ncbi:MAG: metallophosphoesterase [Candidatus Helarchaeota archaeon]|nr:metallophosphoesterase [Candidatus Helarchaeota archaeon]
MTKYKLVALSDLHLGHESCLLRNEGSNEGLNETINAMKTKDINGPEIQEIETLVLIGDIIDAALSRAQNMCEAAGTFFRELTSRIKIKKIVMIPGNHDRILLKDATATIQNLGKMVQYSDGVFPVEGIDVELDSELFNIEINYYQKLSLLQLYGLKNKQDQLNFEKNTKIYFANPIFYEKIGEKSFIFNHGLHMYMDYFQLISKAKTLEDIENNTIDIVTSIWNNRGDRELTIQKSFWAGIQFLRSQLLNFKNVTDFWYKPWTLLKKVKSKWNRKFNPFRNLMVNPKIEFFQKLWAIFKDIPDKNISKNNMIFVFGHTHTSEFKEFYVDYEIGNVVNFNTGAWNTWHKKLKPDSCILTVNENEAKLWRYQYPKDLVKSLAPF